MNRVDLYIDGNRCDMFPDETVVLTKRITDFKDASKVLSNFTKSFSLPANKVNNDIFSYYYNIDVSGVFDPQQKIPAYLECNGIEIDNGNVELLSVTTVKHRPEAYNVVFYGAISELKNVFGDDTLDVLDVSGLNHNLTYTNIRDSWSLALEDGNVVYPLSNTDRPWIYSSSIANDARNIKTNGILVNELKPAVRIRYFLDRIFEHYGLTYESDLIDSSGIIDQTYMLMHRESGDLINEENLADNEVVVNGSNAPASGLLKADFTNKQRDVNNNFDLTTDTYTAPITGNYTFWFDVFFSNSTNGDTTTIWYAVNGGSLISLATGVCNTRPDSNGVFRPWTLFRQFSLYLYAGDTIELYSSSSASVSRNCVFRTDLVPLARYDDTIKIAENLPKEFKIIDFLNGVLRMFNALIIPKTLTHFEIQNRNDYYQQGTVKNWNKYIDIEQITIDKPDVFGDISFKYSKAEDGTSIAFAKIFKREYASTFFNPEIDYAKDSLDIEVAFGASLPIEMLDQNASGGVAGNTNIYILRMLDEEDKPVVDVPRIFYYDASLLQNCSDYELQNGVDASGLPTFTTENEVPYCSMFTDISGVTDTESLCFSIEEPFVGIPTKNTLYQNYYNQYIQRVFDPQQRVLKVKARLPLSEFYKLELSDNIFFDGHYFTINTISYNMATQEAKIELSTFFRERVYRTVDDIAVGGGVALTSVQGTGKTDELYNLNNGSWRRLAPQRIQRNVVRGKPTRMPFDGYVLDYPESTEAE